MFTINSALIPQIADTRDCINVTMNQGKKLTNRMPQKMIRSDSFAGCNGVLAYGKSDEEQEIVLTHYDPLSTFEQYNTVKELLTLPVSSVIFFTPGEYKKQDDGKWRLEITDKSLIQTRFIESLNCFSKGNLIKVPYNSSESKLIQASFQTMTVFAGYEKISLV
jgi:hypothetical protein